MDLYECFWYISCEQIVLVKHILGTEWIEKQGWTKYWESITVDFGATGKGLKSI